MNDEHQPIVDTLPQPVPTGTDTYYRERGADFARRRPDRRQPPYYLEYGDKCLHQFRAVAAALSRGGQEWLESTLQLLQEAIEERLRHGPADFDQLELDDRGFQDFAFSTHAQAYIDGGIFELPADDLWRILRTPDITDVVSRDGISEIRVVLAELDRHDFARILTRTSDRRAQHGSSRILGWIIRHTRHSRSPAT
jgi:hypothetical protein